MKENSNLARLPITKRAFALLTVLIVAVLVVNLDTNSQADQIIADHVISTSIIRLIAHPEIYEGKKVMVVGYYVAAQELSSLYLVKEFASIGGGQSALWVNLNQSTTNKLVNLKINSAYVRVIGTFHSNGTDGAGHMGAWPGELLDVTFFQKCR